MSKKLALVTGARRGIGLGIAQKLAAEGCDIAIADVVAPDEAADAVSSLQKLGAQVLDCQADVSSAPDRARLIEQIRQHFGRLNVLVNNAGVAPRSARIFSTPPKRASTGSSPSTSKARIS